MCYMYIQNTYIFLTLQSAFKFLGIYPTCLNKLKCTQKCAHGCLWKRNSLLYICFYRWVKFEPSTVVPPYSLFHFLLFQLLMVNCGPKIWAILLYLVCNSMWTIGGSIGLGQWFLKSPRTSSIVIWQPTRTSSYWNSPRATESETLGIGPETCVDKTSWGLWSANMWTVGGFSKRKAQDRYLAPTWAIFWCEGV